MYRQYIPTEIRDAMERKSKRASTKKSTETTNTAPYQKPKQPRSKRVKTVSKKKETNIVSSILSGDGAGDGGGNVGGEPDMSGVVDTIGPSTSGLVVDSHNTVQNTTEPQNTTTDVVASVRSRRDKKRPKIKIDANMEGLFDEEGNKKRKLDVVGHNEHDENIIIDLDNVAHYVEVTTSERNAPEDEIINDQSQYAYVQGTEEVWASEDIPLYQDDNTSTPINYPNIIASASEEHPQITTQNDGYLNINDNVVDTQIYEDGSISIEQDGNSQADPQNKLEDVKLSISGPVNSLGLPPTSPLPLPPPPSSLAVSSELVPLDTPLPQLQDNRQDMDRVDTHYTGDSEAVTTLVPYFREEGGDNENIKFTISDGYTAQVQHYGKINDEILNSQHEKDAAEENLIIATLESTQSLNDTSGTGDEVTASTQLTTQPTERTTRKIKRDYKVLENDSGGDDIDHTSEPSAKVYKETVQVIETVNRAKRKATVNDDEYIINSENGGTENQTKRRAIESVDENNINSEIEPIENINKMIDSSEEKKNYYDNLFKNTRTNDSPVVTARKIYNTKIYSKEDEIENPTQFLISNTYIEKIYEYLPRAHLESKENLYQNLLSLYRQVEQYKNEFNDITMNSKPLIYLSHSKIQNILLKNMSTNISANDEQIRNYLKGFPFEDFLIVLGRLMIEYQLFSGTDNKNIENLLLKLKTQIHADKTIPTPTFFYSDMSASIQQKEIMERAYNILVVMCTALDIIAPIDENRKNIHKQVPIDMVSEYFKIFKWAFNQ